MSGLHMLEAAPEVWSCIPKWMFFLHPYWTHLPGFRASEELAACETHSRIIFMLTAYLETAAVIFETRGVRQIVARAWKSYIRDASPKRALPHFLTVLVEHLDNHADFEGNLEGVGGTIPDLVSVLIQQISYAVAAPKSKGTMMALAAVTDFLEHMGDAEGFHSALISQGMVPALVSAMSALDGSRTNVTYPTITVCLIHLIDHLKQPLGHRPIAEAVKAGLRRSIISFVSFLIPVKHIKRAFSDIQKLLQSPQFMQSPLFDDWEKLATLIKARMNILDTWEAAGKESRRACDNMKCGQTLIERELKRCSACESASYCSHECQAVDWQDVHIDSIAGTIYPHGRGRPCVLSSTRAINGSATIPPGSQTGGDPPSLSTMPIPMTLRFTSYPQPNSLRSTSSRVQNGLRRIALEIPFGERMTKPQDVPPEADLKLAFTLRDTVVTDPG
ncbi:hypothetical protein DFH09DRAFT_1275689 [Mycena vulgaris]|nr:hypothetical protein DFH09DRAFT_1275689 [Mycena vulgaris]